MLEASAGRKTGQSQHGVGGSFTPTAISAARRLLTTVSLCSMSLSAAGCAGRVMPQTTWGHAGAWTIQVTEVSEGPNTFPLSTGVVFVPGEGNDFLWFVMRVKNETAQDRVFGWKRCSLPRLEGAYVPGFVSTNSMLNQVLDDVEIIKAHETVERRITFAYPKQTKPSQLNCAEITLPLKLY